MANTTLINVAAELTEVAAKLRLRTVKVKSGSLGIGSGVIWQPDGLIITNAHVATSNRATVELTDGRVFDAVRTQFDPQQDLAALKIVATDLTAATIGNSEALRVGELVLAVGNPFADSGAVTTGIIHANNPRAIMADLRLYPGNSGGPLADCLGRVVGINTMIVNGLAVAVPSNTVERFLQGNGRPQLGVTLQPVLLSRRSLGLLVLSILPNSAAENAGVQIGDVLIGVSGRLFTSMNDLTKYLHESKGSVPLQILRGRQQFVIYVAVQSDQTAVEAIAFGLLVLHPDAVELLSIREKIVTNPVQTLTPREIEVLGMLGSGLGNKAIAKRLHISEHTVKFHLSSIFQKLSVSSRTEAVAVGVRLGLIML